MSNVVYESQVSKAGKFTAGAQTFDVLDNRKVFAISDPTSLNKNTINPNGTAAFGTWAEFSIPQGYINDLYLVVTLGALTSGNYCNYPGLSLIDSLELKSGSNLLQSYRYCPVMKSVMSRMQSNQRTALLTAAGGTSFASGSVVIPLPLFFNLCGCSFQQEFSTPLNTNLTDNARLTLRVNFRSAAAVAAAGATVGSPTISAVCKVISLETSDALRYKHITEAGNYKYISQDYITTSQSAAIATNTNTVFDLNSFISASLSDVVLYASLVSDIDTAHAYYVSQAISDIQLNLDGKVYFQETSDAQLVNLYESLTISEYLPTASGSDGTIIPFSLSVDYQNSWDGGLCTFVNNLTATLKHQAGANAYIEACARTTSCFYVQNGQFVRVQ